MKRYLTVLLLIILIPTILVFALPPKGFVPILMYHFIFPDKDVTKGKGANSLNVSVKEFERQMQFLKTFGYRGTGANI